MPTSNRSSSSIKRKAEAVKLKTYTTQVELFWEYCLKRGSQLPFVEDPTFTARFGRDEFEKTFPIIYHWDFQQPYLGNTDLNSFLVSHKHHWTLRGNVWCKHVQTETFYKSFMWWKYGSRWNLEQNAMTHIQFAMVLGSVVSPIYKNKRFGSIYSEAGGAARRGKRAYYQFEPIGHYDGTGQGETIATAPVDAPGVGRRVDVA